MQRALFKALSLFIRVVERRVRLNLNKPLDLHKQHYHHQRLCPLQ